MEHWSAITSQMIRICKVQLLFGYANSRNVGAVLPRCMFGFDDERISRTECKLQNCSVTSVVFTQLYHHWQTLTIYERCYSLQHWQFNLNNAKQRFVICHIFHLYYMDWYLFKLNKRYCGTINARDPVLGVRCRWVFAQPLRRTPQPPLFQLDYR